MKAHVIRVASGGSKSWGKWVCVDKRELHFIGAREEGTAFVGTSAYKTWDVVERLMDLRFTVVQSCKPEEIVVEY
jgi:hypothetical protein